MHISMLVQALLHGERFAVFDTSINDLEQEMKEIVYEIITESSCDLWDRYREISKGIIENPHWGRLLILAIFTNLFKDVVEDPEQCLPMWLDRILVECNVQDCDIPDVCLRHTWSVSCWLFAILQLGFFVYLILH